MMGDAVMDEIVGAMRRRGQGGQRSGRPPGCSLRGLLHLPLWLVVWGVWLILMALAAAAYLLGCLLVVAPLLVGGTAVFRGEWLLAGVCLAVIAVTWSVLLLGLLWAERTETER